MFDCDTKRARARELEQATLAPDFWDDNRAAQAHMQKLKLLVRSYEPWDLAESEVDSLLELSEMIGASGDAELASEIESQFAELSHRVDQLEFQSMLGAPEDVASSYLYIHPGAGGTESCDWAQMLMRMYTHWAETHNYKVKLIDLQEGDEAGIASVTLLIEGEYAYGYMKAETGVHRLVRISPFDANKRRHTSFASVNAYPDIQDDIELDIQEKDLRIDTYRSGGKGGQHVNTTDSAVRITHLPTNIVAQCQNERSQHQNREVAMKVLRARLYQYYKEKAEVEQAAKNGEKADISWGNQIRSYVFQPYQMVKDLRTGVETSSIDNVMDGDIDPFIEAWLRSQMGKHHREL
ncbi:MAG: peptide chain release factor 2 [Candidatus Sumerlaeales bacterium]|nr:peptide chain release factor 2 [Candidatus Sumerlaeales bacterium]